MSEYPSYFFFASMVIAVPTRRLNFFLDRHHVGWLNSLRGANAMGMGFIFLFTIGGSRAWSSQMPASTATYTMTYYVVAHFHYVCRSGRCSGCFRGFLLLVPEDVWLHLYRAARQAAFLGDFQGVNLTFFPQHFLGAAGKCLAAT